MVQYPVPNERVVTIRIYTRNNTRAGLSWSSEVAEFYMEMFPEIMEYGYTLSDIAGVYDT